MKMSPENYLLACSRTVVSLPDLAARSASLLHAASLEDTPLPVSLRARPRPFQWNPLGHISEKRCVIVNGERCIFLELT